MLQLSLEQSRVLLSLERETNIARTHYMKKTTEIFFRWRSANEKLVGDRRGKEVLNFKQHDETWRGFLVGTKPKSEKLKESALSWIIIFGVGKFEKTDSNWFCSRRDDVLDGLDLKRRTEIVLHVLLRQVSRVSHLNLEWLGSNSNDSCKKVTRVL